MADAKQAFDKRGFVVTGGLIGAILASSCCIAPLILVMLGIGGVWVGSLTALAPYQWIFLLVAVVCLAAGFRLVYFQPKANCVEGSYCHDAKSSTVIKTVLWIGTTLVIAAIAVNLLTPLLY